MAAYAVTDFLTSADSVTAVMAALEVQIDTIDNTKTLRYVDIIPQPDNTWIGVIIYDA
tara:strand:+ start:18 stop:191 length:174 start_codon:yes stop_codon:yes gene_type:complete